MIITNEERNDDLTLRIVKGEYFDSNIIIDPVSNENVSGYIIKDNVDIVINLSNKNVVDNPMILNNYYYMNVNDKNVILRNMRVRYVKDTVYSVIPNHTYRFLKSKGSFKDKLFVLDVIYECIDPTYTEMLKKATESEMNLNNYGLSGHIDKDGNYIEVKEKKFYFKLVSEDEYEAYKELANEKIDLKTKK